MNFATLMRGPLRRRRRKNHKFKVGEKKMERGSERLLPNSLRVTHLKAVWAPVLAAGGKEQSERIGAFRKEGSTCITFRSDFYIFLQYPLQFWGGSSCRDA